MDAAWDPAVEILTVSPEGTVLFLCMVDPHDRIAFVNQAWRRFARENGDPELPDRAVGTSLWDHVSGAEVRAVYRELFRKARSQEKPIEVPFRCDAPDRRRYLRLRIEVGPSGGLNLVSWLDREEARAPLPFPAVGDQEPLPGPPLAMCAWCKEIRIDNGHGAREWVELEVAVERLRLFDAPTLPRVTHGICTACAAEIDGL